MRVEAVVRFFSPWAISAITSASEVTHSCTYHRTTIEHVSSSAPTPLFGVSPPLGECLLGRTSVRFSIKTPRSGASRMRSESEALGCSRSFTFSAITTTGTTAR